MFMIVQIIQRRNFNGFWMRKKTRKNSNLSQERKEEWKREDDFFLKKS